MTATLLRRITLLGALAVFLGVYFTTPVHHKVAAKLTAWNYATAIADGMESARIVARFTGERG